MNRLFLFATMFSATFAAAQQTPSKILIAVSNHTAFGSTGQQTGAWLSEITHFYEVVHKAGYQVDFVSSLGGKTAIDPASKKGAPARWLENADFSAKMNNTFSPHQVVTADYVAVYFAGGHGTMWDFPHDVGLLAVATALHQQNKYITAVCHGVAGLLELQSADAKPLIHGKKITGFSNAEEKLAGHTTDVPFLLQDELVKRGGIYQKAGFPFAAKVVVDGQFITGQNPASAKGVAKKLLQALSASHQ